MGKCAGMTMTTASAEPKITQDLIAKHGITPAEYENIKKVIAERNHISSIWASEKLEEIEKKYV